MHSLDDVKNRILSRTPLDQLIGESVTVQKRAGRLLACCPFHAEKTPSFYLYGDHYHCFGCGVHGDAISFVQHQQGLGFMEALRWLARRFAIEAPELEQASGNIKKWQQAARQGQILLGAHEFFRQQLQSEAGRQAREYLKDRGFADAALADFGFGYALDEPAALMSYLGSQGYKAAELEANSLVTVYQQRAYDFFRHRLIIPIRDTHGRIIAFGGRALGSQQQKYKNSRYDKGSVLFGLDRARKAMRQKSRAIVVEGYLDALQLHQHGLIETVACQGTALTREHMRALRAATGLVYLLFDGDQAGENASLKALKESLNFPELQFKVAPLPPGEDPDSFVRRHGRDALEAVLAKADDLLSFAIARKLQSSHATAIPSLITQEFVPWLVTIDDPIKQGFLCQKIAELSGIPSQTVAHAVATHGQTKTEILVPLEEPLMAEDMHEGLAPPGPLTPLQFEFLAHLFWANPGELDTAVLHEFLAKELCLDTSWDYFARELINCLEAARAPAQQEASYWVAAQAPHVMQQIMRLRDSAPAFANQNRKKCLTRLRLANRQNNIRATMAALKDQLTIKAADLRQDSFESAGQYKEESQRTLKEITRLSQKLYQIESEMRQI